MKLLTTLLCAAALLPAASFQVSIDTSSLNTQTGTIDIQFNPGSFPAVYNSGTATITNFILAGGTLGSIASGPDGGASGTLPGPLTLVNSNFLNGILYNATFGSTASFLVDLAGPAFTGTLQSILTTLSVSLHRYEQQRGGSGRSGGRQSAGHVVQLSGGHFSIRSA